MFLENLCPPALIYVIFSTIQIIMDTSQGLFNVAFIKFWVALFFTFLLNYMCDRGLGVISWILVFIPFILMTLIITILLYVFGLDPAKGRIHMTERGIEQEVTPEYIDNRPQESKDIDTQRKKPPRENGRIDSIQKDIKRIQKKQENMYKKFDEITLNPMRTSSYTRDGRFHRSQIEENNGLLDDDTERKEEYNLEQDVNDIVKHTEEDLLKKEGEKEPEPSEEGILEKRVRNVCPAGCMPASGVSEHCEVSFIGGVIKRMCPWECEEPGESKDGEVRCQKDEDCHRFCRPATFFDYENTEEDLKYVEEATKREQQEKEAAESNEQDEII